MHVISRNKIDAFCKKYPVAKNSILSWYHEACHSNWDSPQDIKDRYPKASFIKDNKVIFDIKGNDFRLVVDIAYKTKTVFIKWIGTHAEYNKLKF